MHIWLAGTHAHGIAAFPVNRHFGNVGSGQSPEHCGAVGSIPHARGVGVTVGVGWFGGPQGVGVGFGGTPTFCAGAHKSFGGLIVMSRCPN